MSDIEEFIYLPMGLCFVLVIGTVRCPTLDSKVLGKM